MDTTVANLTAGPDKDGADVSPQPRPERHHDRGLIHLARPYADGALAQTLKSRRSTKAFRPSRIDLDALSRLLATTLSTGPARSRPYGSAHGRYEVLVTVVVAVQGLAPAVYRYLPDEHALLRCSEQGDHRARLAHVTYDAPWLPQCPVALILSADLAAANRAFVAQQAGRGERFCWLKAGLLTQNIYLWAADNGLGTVFVGGLDPTKTQAVTASWLPSSHSVLGILPIGHPARPTSTP